MFLETYFIKKISFKYFKILITLFDLRNLELGKIVTFLWN